jgi:hypothetical protein
MAELPTGVEFQFNNSVANSIKEKIMRFKMLNSVDRGRYGRHP